GGVVVVTPLRWAAPPALVSALLAGLRGNPLVSPVTITSLFDQVPVATTGTDPNAAPVVRTLAPVAPNPPPVTAAEYARASAERDAVASLFPPTDPRVTIGDRVLLSALGSAWSNPAGRQRAA